MKNEHEEMEKLLRSELDKEAQAIMAEIEADESLKDLKLPDENEEAIMQKIQKLEEKKADYEEMPEEDREAFRLGREMQALQENGETVSDENEGNTHKTVPFKKRRRKLYLLVAIVAILAFAMSMTSIGEVPLVTEIKNQILGTSKMVKMNSEREGDESIVEGQHTEVEGYDEIKKEFGVEIIRLGYLPSRFKFYDYEIDSTLNKASMIYRNGNTFLEYRMFFSPIEQSAAYEVEDELLEKEDILVNDTTISMKCYKVPDTKDVLCVAQFKCQNVSYMLTGNLESKDMKEILKNLKIL